MDEYKLNILSFHYNFEKDTKKMTIEDRIKNLERVLTDNKDKNKEIDVVMCSEFYLCKNIDNKYSSITRKDKEYIHKKFINISETFLDILFLPGTYYIYDKKQKCYKNILPIFHEGKLIKEYEKFSVPGNLDKEPIPLCATKYKPGTIEHKPGTIEHKLETIEHKPGTIEHKPGTIEHKPKINNVIKHKGKTFILGICSDYSCDYTDEIIKKYKSDKLIGLFVAYAIGSIIQKNIPIIIVDGINLEKYNMCVYPKNGNYECNIENLSEVLDKQEIPYLNINYITLNVNNLEKEVTIKRFTLRNILQNLKKNKIMENLKDYKINEDIDKFITEVKSIFKIIKKIVDLYKVSTKKINDAKLFTKFILETTKIIQLYNNNKLKLTNNIQLCENFISETREIIELCNKLSNYFEENPEEEENEKKKENEEYEEKDEFIYKLHKEKITDNIELCKNFIFETTKIYNSISINSIKQKYLKYKTKYLELKKLLKN